MCLRLAVLLFSAERAALSAGRRSVLPAAVRFCNLFGRRLPDFGNGRETDDNEWRTVKTDHTNEVFVLHRANRQQRRVPAASILFSDAMLRDLSISNTTAELRRRFVVCGGTASPVTFLPKAFRM